MDCADRIDPESVGYCVASVSDDARAAVSSISLYGDRRVKTTVINLYGGPGTGKSTTMAGVFYILKSHGVNCEMAPEYAKEKVWEKSLHILDNQLYVFAKQHHTLTRLLGQVDVVITDSPLLLSLYYGDQESKAFHDLVVEEYKKIERFDVFLTRKKAFQPIGRLQTETEAIAIDDRLRAILQEHGVQYEVYPAVPESAYHIADRVIALLNAAKGH